jgi:hypothetical protein
MTAPVPAPVAIPPEVRPGSLLPQPAKPVATAIARPHPIAKCRCIVSSLEPDGFRLTKPRFNLKRKSRP